MQRLGLRRMFTKLEQRSWLKLKQAGIKQQKSYRGLEEACGTAALPYRTVARWVQAFRCRPLRPDNQQNRGCQRHHARPHRWERVLHNFGEYIECLWKYELCRCAVSKVTADLPKLKFHPIVFRNKIKLFFVVYISTYVKINTSVRRMLRLLTVDRPPLPRNFGVKCRIVFFKISDLKLPIFLQFI